MKKWFAWHGVRQAAAALAAVGVMATLARPVAAAEGGAGKVAPGQAADAAALGRMFKHLMETVNPVTPAEHREIVRQGVATAKARELPAPKFRNVMRIVPLDPTARIPAVQMTLNQVSAIDFVDITGQPWPIRHCDWSAGFTGQKAVKGGHVLVLQATSLADNGSLVCEMQGLATPVRLRLVSGNGIQDLGFDARIPAPGPNAKTAPYDVGATQLVAGNDTLSAFLYGVPPQGAAELQVAGGAGTRAWLYQGALYVRTPMVLVSPGPRAEATLENLHVYQLPPVPLLAMDDGGQAVNLAVKGAHMVAPSLPAAYGGDGSPGDGKAGFRLAAEAGGTP